MRYNPPSLLPIRSDSALANPTLWGYKSARRGHPFESDPSASPFQLRLIGETDDKAPVTIPVELDKTVIHVHSRLSYPDYYDLLATAVCLHRNSLRVRRLIFLLSLIRTGPPCPCLFRTLKIRGDRLFFYSRGRHRSHPYSRFGTAS